ncbi:MAG: pentapeptide repeat-containing protein [Comamonas sp.]
MADRKYGEPAPPTNHTVTGADWYRRELEREEYGQTLFLDLDMTEAQSSGCVFQECTFRRARFNASVHQSSAFLNCTFVSCNFFDARFTGCKLLGSMFDDCQFHHMQVADGDWAFVGMPGADLRRAAFSRTRLREADLTGARCQGGSIRDVDLSGAWLHSADFSGCDLRGTDLSALEPGNVQLKNAIITIEQTITIAEALGFDVRVQ